MDMKMENNKHMSHWSKSKRIPQHQSLYTDLSSCAV